MRLAILLAALASATAMPSCDSWTPVGPVGGHYNTTTSISNEKLNVHLVPHTHDDPGWLITVDQYYTQEVDYILESVVTELLKNPNRRFMYVEQSFFQRWWREQSHEMKTIVKKLVKEGRLDLSVNGGWVMHDEATCHYSVMIDQTAFGHAFLLHEFGVKPRIGWQIDPFGHSSTQGSLLSAGVGFDALYFARMDYQDFEKRKAAKDLEFMWEASPSRGEKIFTGMMQNHYEAPHGFQFEAYGPIKDDPLLHDFNVCDEIKSFVDQSLERAAHTKGNHVFWPMGTDFTYQNGLKWFKNMDKLIHYANQEGRVNVLYSTLGQYTDLKLADKSLQWSVKTDDFFPYADQPNAYWTGYFTSRPALKRFARVANGVLQAMRQLEVQAAKSSQLMHLTASVGVAQHHDAITGTEKQHVADDYAQRLSEGLAAAAPELNALLGATGAPFALCLLANVSVCEPSTSAAKEFEVVVYNPLPHAATFGVSIPIDTPGAGVVAVGTDAPVAASVAPFVPVHADAPSAPHTLLLRADVPALGLQRYRVTKNAIGASTAADVSKLENDHVKVELDLTAGSLVSLVDKATNTAIKLRTTLGYYQAYLNGNGVNSGAYIFRPNTSTLHELPPVSAHGCDVTALQQACWFRFGAWGVLRYELRPWDTTVTVEWTVGPIPIDDHQGKEVIVRFASDVASNKRWYTDSNGLEFVERVRDYRATWNLTLHNDEERVTANYVPITTAAYLRSDAVQLTVLTDRAQGCASLADGQLDVMVHRRLLGDDHRGVDEALNETETFTLRDGRARTQGLTVRGQFAVGVAPIAEAMARLRTAATAQFVPPLVALRAGAGGFVERPLVGDLVWPANVGLTALHWAHPHCRLVRLSHLFAVGEHPEWSKPASVDLLQLVRLQPGETAAVKELSLSANAVKGPAPSTVTLRAMEVKSFELCVHGPRAAVYDGNRASLTDPLDF
ncbi:lysosomal alpha-mannosidase [Achlya hypogyna]|uniref:Alpha-mannosidase n=1 Tax=Achlya hypogyna TaxID=1202772 RepID=A0A0A7CPA6_ACHHY|nr:secreted protein [Achlya hypogyna]OQR97299.1 lysosomal alpha-mannosidase [Achlya hypogyna]